MERKIDWVAAAPFVSVLANTVTLFRLIIEVSVLNIAIAAAVIFISASAVVFSVAYKREKRRMQNFIDADQWLGCSVYLYTSLSRKNFNKLQMNCVDIKCTYTDSSTNGFLDANITYSFKGTNPTKKDVYGLELYNILTAANEDSRCNAMFCDERGRQKKQVESRHESINNFVVKRNLPFTDGCVRSGEEFSCTLTLDWKEFQRISTITHTPFLIDPLNYSINCKNIAFSLENKSSVAINKMYKRTANRKFCSFNPDKILITEKRSGLWEVELCDFTDKDSIFVYETE